MGWLVDGIMDVLASILWGLCDIFFVLINLMEELFQKFAGLDTMWTKSGEAVEGDVVLYLINTPIIWEVFLSLVVFSLFLLIILTTFAVVKNQYAEKPKPPMSFISNAIKGLLMYLMIPVCVVAGLTVGNIVLQAIDGATSVFVEEENGSASGMLYIAAAYNGNRIRLNGGDALSDLWYKLTPIHDDLNALGIYSAADAKQLDQDNEEDAKVLEKAAMLMDNAFINGELSGWLGSDIYSITAVWTYYDVFSMSLLTIWVGGAFMIWVLLGITWGLLNRIFKMVIGYCIAPVLVANYPLDDGAALKNWTKDFSKQATMAYAAVGVMNVFYSVLPFINEINILGYESIFNNLVQLFVLISGLLLVKNLIGQVAGYFGTGDALSEGLSAGKAISGKFKTGAKNVMGGAAGMFGGIKEAKGIGKSKFVGALTGMAKGSGIADKFDIQKPVKDWKAAYKSGGEHYKDMKTTMAIGQRAKNNEARFSAAEIMDKQNKSIAGEIEAIEKDYEARINSASTQAEKDSLAKERDGKIVGIKSKVEYARALHADEIRQLEQESKKLEKSQAIQSYMDNLEGAYQRKERLNVGILKSMGLNATASNLMAMSNPDMLEMIRDKDGNQISEELIEKIKEHRQSMVGDFAEADNAIEQAKTALIRQGNSSEKAQKYINNALGGLATGLLQGTLTAGDLKEARRRIRSKATELDAKAKSLEAAGTALDEKIATDVGKGIKDYDDKDIGKIAKSGGGK